MANLQRLRLVSNIIDIQQGIKPAHMSSFHTKESVLPIIKKLTEEIEQQEKQLARLNSTYANLFKHSKVGLAEVALDGFFLDVNQAWCNLVRRSKEELLSLRWQDITMPEFISKDEENVKSLIENKSTETYTMEKEYYYLDKQGAKIPIPLQLTVSCVYDQEQELLYFISQAIDVKTITEDYIKARGCFCGKQ